MNESRAVRVATSKGDETWDLAIERAGRDWLLALAGHSTSWSAEGPDLFEALRHLRVQLDGAGILLCVNGSRPEAWASGMQRDMGEGRVVYLCTIPRDATRPLQVETLAEANADEVGSVIAQDEFHERWMASFSEPAT